MKWIKVEEKKPELIEVKGIDWSKSKKLLVLIDGKEPLVAEYNKGEDWEQWYCPAYEDVVEGVTAWCDCIPKID